jgi:hypothetical protein
MKAKCTHCGYEFDEPVPILNVYSKAPESGKFVHNVCPKCLYIDTVEISFEKRDVPLDWKEFEKSAEEHAKQEQEMYNKLFAKHALSYFRNPSANCISYIFNDERYGKNTIDMLIMDILVYLEHKEMARRFANLKGLEELIAKYELLLKNIEEAKVRYIANYDNKTELHDTAIDSIKKFIEDLKKLIKT